MQRDDRLFRNPWWIVFGSVLGLAVGNGPVMQFTFGVFVKPLTAQFGSDRGTISAALTLGLCVTGLCTPFAGRLVDRFGARAVTLPAICLFALSLVTLGFIPDNAWAFVAVYAVMGVFAAGQTPLPYAKAVSAAFDSKRGLALGVTMAGVGLGTVLLPIFCTQMIGAFGWRGAYIGLGAVLFCVGFPAVLLFLRDPISDRRAGLAARAELAGFTGRQALRSGSFWILAVAFFFVAMACAGVLVHAIPIMTDRGVPPQQAAVAISIGGLALIVGRLLSGWLLDRTFAPYVAMAFFVAPLLGIVLLFLTDSAGFGMAATVLVGVGLGAEVDLIAFLICRYLGLRAFGEIYGYLFLTFMLGSGSGPFLMGLSYAKTGSYGFTMACFAAGLLVATASIARLGPYRFQTEGARVPASPVLAPHGGESYVD